MSMQRRLLIYLWGSLFLLAAVRSTYASTTCVFNTSGSVMTLTGDCSTDTTIAVPNGYTLDGKNFTITVADPPNGGHFLGAVVKNAGALANVVNLRITTAGLSNVCDADAAGLRGILLAGASGTIYGNTVTNLNQGASACPEGNGIEVQNFNTSGVTPAVQTVEITSNKVFNYQKTGIACDGYVSCLVRSNTVGTSAAEAYQPVNGIQIGYGAGAVVENNDVGGNSWPGSANFVSTAILLYYAAGGTAVRHNNLMEGNADIGIYAYTDGATVDNNRVYENGPDLNQAGWDVGVYIYSPSLATEAISTNSVLNNKVRGYLFGYNSPALTTRMGGNNKANSSPAGK
jgi:hypothetical protein